MVLDYCTYYQIAADCKNKLQEWSGKTEIRFAEWLVLKGYGFPFDLPEGAQTECVMFFTPVEIKRLDSAPLIKLLREEFGLAQDVGQTEINNIRDYAWSHILSSISYVWGG